MNESPASAQNGGRASFTDEEWRLLQFASFWVMSQIAWADGDIDQQEFVVLAREMGDAQRYKHPLVRELLTSSAERFGEIWSAFQADPRRVDEGLLAVSALLDRALPPSDAKAVKIALLSIGHWVADASGGGAFGLSSRISPEETQALAFIMDLLGLTPTDLKPEA